MHHVSLKDNEWFPFYFIDSINCSDASFSKTVRMILVYLIYILFCCCILCFFSSGGRLVSGCDIFSNALWKKGKSVPCCYLIQLRR